MKIKNNSERVSVDGKPKNHKGESQQSAQKGARSVSKKGNGKHSKDESGGSRKNTTKKQQNSI